MVTSRSQYVKMAIMFRTEQLFINIERRFELIAEFADITLESKNVKLKEIANVMEKANGVMVSILNKSQKFEDKEKLLTMFV